MIFISAFQSTSLGLLTLAFMLGCSTPQQSRSSRLTADGVGPSDQRALQIKAQQERDQDRRDRQLVSRAKKQPARADQSVSMDSFSLPPKVRPQKSTSLEVTPGKILAGSTDSLANKMPEGQLFAEIVDRYEARDLWGFESRAKVFLGKFANSDRRDEVMYMKGLMELGERNYGVALAQFNKILRDHPNGRKAPSALFAKGVTFERMNLKREAKQALAKVVNLFPGSPEAGRATTEMKMIK